MLLVKAENIKKYFGDRLILDIDEFAIYSGDKIGVVGANGAGKTTLLKLLLGELEAEEGYINTYGSFSYVPQFSDYEEQEYLEQEGDHQKLLKELNVNDKLYQDKISGGEETRLKLAGAFGKQGHIVLLDEPTANLDMEGIRLLQQKLKRMETLLIISHDRALLDEICTKIVEVAHGKITQYPGNFSEYERLKEAEKERYKKEYEAYLSEKKRLEEVYVEKRKLAENAAKIPKGMSPREAHMRDFLCVTGRNHDGKQKNLHRAADAVKKRIDHMEVKERPKEEPRISLNFKLTNPPENKIIMEASELNFAYGDHAIFQNASFRIPNHKKIAIVGPNGVGKTTLLNIIRASFQEGEFRDTIRIVPKAVPGFLYQKMENLQKSETVLENAMKDSVQTESVVRSILAGFLFTSNDLGKKVEVLSGGERMKLALAKLLVSNANVLVLDEPTNYLDMPSIMTLQKRIKEYEGTILFVSHDRHFINETADYLLMIEDQKTKLIQGNLKAYEEAATAKNKEAKKSAENSLSIHSERMRLELRITQLLAEMGLKKNETKKEILEAEYLDVLSRLSSLQ